MDKQQLISLIKTQLDAGKISREDLYSLAGATASVVTPQSMVSDRVVPRSPVESSKNLIKTFYSIGAIIAIVGVGILVFQNWDEIGFWGRVLVTLGISLATYISGLLLRAPGQRVISQIMFIISAALAPLGSYVLLEETFIDFTLIVQFGTACVLFVIFAAALFITKRNILVLVSIGFATWAYYALIMKVFGFNFYNQDFLQWASMLVGASYIFIAYGYRSVWMKSDGSDVPDAREKRAVRDILNGLGALAILGAGIFIGGVFDILYIALIFGAFYGSVFLKSRMMLIFGAIFLMAHIIKLTSKYFVDSIGWPVALIAIGFLVIGVGYLTFYLNKKFISSR